MPIRSDQGIVVGPWSRAGAQPPYPASAEKGGRSWRVGGGA